MELQGRLDALKREGLGLVAVSDDPVPILADFAARRASTKNLSARSVSTPNERDPPRRSASAAAFVPANSIVTFEYDESALSGFSEPSTSTIQVCTTCHQPSPSSSATGRRS